MITLERPILVVSERFPPAVGGSATIMKNLTDAFEAGSVVLAVDRPPRGRSTAGATRHPLYHFMSTVECSGRADGWWRRAQLPIAVRRLRSAAHAHGCAAIIGVYPDAFALHAAFVAAKQSGLPFVGYLHDTIAEGMADTRWAGFGRKVQAEVFAGADLLFVMSQGMADLYRRRYDLATIPLVHTYPEKIGNGADIDGTVPGNGTSDEPTALWSGNIYRINRHAVRRAFRALSTQPGLTLNLATSQTVETLTQLGVCGDNVRLTYFSANERPAYLDFLRRQTFHIVALDWPDESPVHPDELGTIFPTKTPEYLASGRPILVHCPAEYFLARFFKEHGCGEVICERSEEALVAGIQRLIADRGHARDLGRKAIDAASMFRREAVAATFTRYLNRAINQAGTRS